MSTHTCDMTLGQDEYVGEYENRVTIKFMLWVGVPLFLVVGLNYLLDLLGHLDYIYREIPFRQRLVLFSTLLLLYYLLLAVKKGPVREDFS